MREPAHHRADRRPLTAAPSAPLAGLDDAAGQHRPARLQPLPDHLQPELVDTNERGQVRASIGSVEHVEVFQMVGVRTSIIGRPRPLPGHRRAARHHIPATPSIVMSPFVQAIGGPNRHVEAVVVSTIALAQALGIQTTAEGVETHEQLDRLGELGCDFAQGYLFARPAPAREAMAHVSADGQWAGPGSIAAHVPQTMTHQ